MNTVFFDLETQYLFSELGMRDHKSRDPSRLKLAVAGTLSDDCHLFFHEDQVEDLLKILDNADLIIGHNLFRFDYLVLQPYADADVVKSLDFKTFDTMLELKKLTNCWTSLDDLCGRNLGMRKTVNTLKIPKMWRDGKHQEVIEYLLNDLKMTESLYNHGKKNKKLKYEYKEYGKSFGEREVEVDW